MIVNSRTHLRLMWGGILLSSDLRDFYLEDGTFYVEDGNYIEGEHKRCKRLPGVVTRSFEQLVLI